MGYLDSKTPSPSQHKVNPESEPWNFLIAIKIWMFETQGFHL